MKTFLVYLATSSILPAIVLSQGIAKDMLEIGSAGFLFACSIIVFMQIFGSHRFWHLLPCAFAWFFVAPYFIINHDVAYSFFVVIGLPFLLLTACAGWGLTRLAIRLS